MISFIEHRGARPRVVRLSEEAPTWVFSTGGRTDEGWESTSTQLTLERDEQGRLGVRCIFATDGRDCDGRLSSYAEFWCDAADLRAGHLGRWPRWQLIERSQRDYQAEAAGY